MQIKLSGAFYGGDQTDLVRHDKSFDIYLVKVELTDCHKVGQVTLSIMQSSDKTHANEYASLWLPVHSQVITTIETTVHWRRMMLLLVHTKAMETGKNYKSSVDSIGYFNDNNICGIIENNFIIP